MKSRKHNYVKKAGLPPESLVYTGSMHPSEAMPEWLVYDEKTCEKKTLKHIQELDKWMDKSKINLLVINNINNITLIQSIGEYFGIHTMLLEDVLNTAHPPKLEESGEHMMLTLKVLTFSGMGDLESQHVSFILGDYFVLVFKDFEKRIFNDLESRILSGKSRARQRKADYLFYLLIDTLVDSYYPVMHEIYNRIDKMEELLLEKPSDNYIHNIYTLKQTTSNLREVIYPVRESLMDIVQGDSPLLEPGTVACFHDVRDHINHIIQMFESGRDTLSDLIELNNANISNKLNSSMNLLTIITTLFIPLTLIAGIYGMNFRFMPELQWRLGYPFAGLLMLVTAGIMLLIMKRKKLL
jgi:magnesium transporter